MRKLFILFFTVALTIAGCSTPTYDEKMARVDWLFSQGRYIEAERELSKIAEERAQQVIPKRQRRGGSHE